MSKKIINGDDLRKQLENPKPNLKQFGEEMMAEWLSRDWCSCEQKATLNELKAAHEKLEPFLPLLNIGGNLSKRVKWLSGRIDNLLEDLNEE
jgi:hypothetical protein